MWRTENGLGAYLRTMRNRTSRKASERVRLLLPLAFLAVSACAPTRPRVSPPRPGTSHVTSPSGAPKSGGVAFVAFDKAAFDRAAREGKLVLLDGAAEWCHWCHVMDAQTYADARVKAALEKGFVSARVDIDERPDIQERYADYGWPATILFDASGRELGAYRGYLPPDRLLAILDEAREPSRVAGSQENRVAVPRDGNGETTATELGRFEDELRLRMEGFYDEKEGGFGTFQKAPLGWNNAYLLRRARDPKIAEDARAKARERVTFTLDKQAKLIDPVWGGIYQYSDGATWESPHYEKLMTFQAPAIENYAELYALTKDPTALSRARALKGYITSHLRENDLFGATQDADLNAHESGKPYMTGHAFHALDDRGRRALGEPRVERRAYPRENGLAIAALVTYSECTGDRVAEAEALATAKKILATHQSRGGLAHEAANDPALFHLADAAMFGLALVRLYERTKDPTLLSGALLVRDALLRTMWDDEHGGFFTHTKDPAAVGVFQKRRMPLDENAFAARFFTRLARIDPKLRAWAFSDSDAMAMRQTVARTLFAVLTKENIEDRGRMLGEVLLAVAEARDLLSSEK